MYGTLFLVLVFAIAIVARYAFELWIHRRKSREVLCLFAQLGAFNPISAQRPDQLGLSLSSWRLGLRDYRSEAFRALVARRMIAQTDDGRYYLSPEGRQLYRTLGEE